MTDAKKPDLAKGYQTAKQDHSKLLMAIAKVNGHPDPEAYAKAVSDAMEAA